MSSRDHQVTLRQIQEYARRAQDVCAGRSLEELRADWQSLLALERALEIVGEAVRRLPDDLRASHPQVDWRAIAGMRDRLIHGYDDVDHGILWKAVQERVPELLVTVERMLGAMQAPPHS